MVGEGGDDAEGVAGKGVLARSREERGAVSSLSESEEDGESERTSERSSWVGMVPGEVEVSGVDSRVAVGAGPGGGIGSGTFEVAAAAGLGSAEPAAGV